MSSSFNVTLYKHVGLGKLKQNVPALTISAHTLNRFQGPMREREREGERGDRERGTERERGERERGRREESEKERVVV